MGFLPDGPLHPEIAYPALAAGALVTSVVALSARRWGVRDRVSLALVLATGASTLVAARVEHAPWYLLRHAGTSVRRDTMLAAAAIAVLTAVAARTAPRGALVVCFAALGIAWAAVPDTEAPLALGCALAVPSLWSLGVRWPASQARTLGLALLGGAVGGAAGIGARGMPERIWFPVIGAALVALAATTAHDAKKRSFLRLRR